MATVQTFSNYGTLLIADRRKVADDANPITATAHAALESHATADARLAALAAGTYTAAKLQEMNWNDKIFALRTLEDPTGIQ